MVKLEWQIGCSAICTEWGWPCIGIDMGDAILVFLNSKGSGRYRLRRRERQRSLRAIRRCSTVTIVDRKSVDWDEREAIICSRLPLFCAGAWQCRQAGGEFYVGNVAMGHGWSILASEYSEGWRVGTRPGTDSADRTVKGRRGVRRGELGKQNKGKVDKADRTVKRLDSKMKNLIDS